MELRHRESLVCLDSLQPSLLAQVAAEITNATLDTKNSLGENPPRELRVLVAESLLQPIVALERPTASWSDLIPTEPL